MQNVNVQILGGIMSNNGARMMQVQYANDAKMRKIYYLGIKDAFESYNLQGKCKGKKIRRHKKKLEVGHKNFIMSLDIQ